MNIETALILGGFAQLSCAFIGTTVSDRGLNQSYLVCALSCLVAICMEAL